MPFNHLPISSSSAMRQEEIDELLIMDWWFGNMSPKSNKSEVSGAPSKEFARLLSDGLAPIGKRLDTLAEDQLVIKAKVDSFSNSGWKQAGKFIISIGAPAAIISLFIALLSIALTAVYTAFSHVKEETAFRTHTEDRLVGIEGKLAALNVLLASSKPLSSESQKAVKKALLDARQSKASPIPASVIAQSAVGFIEAAKTDPQAWGVALQLAAYKSHLNLSEGPKIPAAHPLSNAASIRPMIPITTGPQDTKSPMFGAAGKAVPAEDGAYLKWEGRAEPVFKTGYGPEYFVIDGTGTKDSISLNGATLRNVIFRSLIITYSGETIHLKNVTFIDCTFNVAHSEGGILLLNTLFGNSLISFSI